MTLRTVTWVIRPGVTHGATALISEGTISHIVVQAREGGRMIEKS